MAKRSYETSRIRVHWNAERCIHTAICLTNLPEVFNLKRRPWVDIDAAQADLIAATIEKCPSGALTYERLDGEPGEQPPEKTTVTPLTNGPLMIQGEVEIRDAQGNLFAKGTRMTLCRCGQSQNHPFCDLSHRKAGFRVRPLAIDPDREQAQSPGDIQSGDGTR